MTTNSEEIQLSIQKRVVDSIDILSRESADAILAVKEVSKHAKISNVEILPILYALSESSFIVWRIKDQTFALVGTQSESTSIQSTQNVTQNFQGAVGTVQTGNNNTANVTMNLGTNAKEILDLIEELGNLANDLPENQKAKVIDQLEDLKEESRKPNPKASRVESILSTLWMHGGKAVELATKIAQLAKAFGVGLPG